MNLRKVGETAALIVLNNRLAKYQEYLEYALARRYRLSSFAEWQLHCRDANERGMILRHDVDHSPENAWRMFDIERKLGVTSSWYFLWETVDEHLIRELSDYGSEVGLHYNTLATYCAAMGIRAKSAITDEDVSAMRSTLKAEIDAFRTRFDVPCRTIASHGDELNQKLQLSNNFLVPAASYPYYGIDLEVYDEEFYTHFCDVHIMDRNISENAGFAYNTEPVSAVDARARCIVFLTHPVHWRETGVARRVRLLLKLLLGRFHFTSDRVFQRIAQ